MNTSTAQQVYNESLLPLHKGMGRVVRYIWTAFVLLAIEYIGFVGPFDAAIYAMVANSGAPVWVNSFITMPILMIIRGILLIEAGGYIFHRFFEHVGGMTRKSQTVREAQQLHWIHHMIFYPIGTHYKRADSYSYTEHGIPWSWTPPFFISFIVLFVLNGVTIATGIIIVSAVAYALLFRYIHECFHVTTNPWRKSRYFQWLEDIHILHHWDQYCNFTITTPLMDILCFTYKSPAQYKKQIKSSLEDHMLSASDIINWRYLLLSASPSEYAAFISAAKKYPRSLQKLEALLPLLKKVSDPKAKTLYKQAIKCLKAIDTKESARILRKAA